MENQCEQSALDAVVEATKNARKIFLLMLLACAYCLLTILATTDAGLLTNSISTPLPIIGTKIAIVWFYRLAPPFLLGLYIYFHLYAQRLWERLAELDLSRGGYQLSQRIDPWFLNALVCRNGDESRRSRPRFLGLQFYVAWFLGWVLVPLTLFFTSLRYMKTHDERTTFLNLAVLSAACVYGWMCSRAMRRSLGREGEKSPIAKARWKVLLYWVKDCVSAYWVVVLYWILVLIPPITSVACGPNLDTYTCWIPAAVKLCLACVVLWFIPFIFWIPAVLTVILVCVRWVRRWEDVTSSYWLVDLGLISIDLGCILVCIFVCGLIYWSGRKQSCRVKDWVMRLLAKTQRDFCCWLRFTLLLFIALVLLYSLLVERYLGHVHSPTIRWLVPQVSLLFVVNLEHVDVSTKPANWTGRPDQLPLVKGAYLRSADLRHALALGAFLTQADLQSADLRFADLRETHLNNAQFFNADLRNANLSSSDLAGASLGTTNLTDANLSRATLSNAQLSNANLRGAIVRWARLNNTDMRSATLDGADLSSADLTDADLTDTSLAGTVLWGANLENIRNWEKITSMKCTQIYGVINPPDGFREFATSKGAISAIPPEEWNELPECVRRDRGHEDWKLFRDGLICSVGRSRQSARRRK